MNISLNKEKISKFVLKYQDNKGTFNINRLVQTWQVSHIWFVKDSTENYECVEEFIAKVIVNNESESHHISQDPWSIRIDLKQWVFSLKIVEVNHIKLEEAHETAVRDFQESEELEGKKPNWFDMGLIPDFGWHIEETDEPRHPVGSTDIYVYKSKDSYVFLEIHWES